MGKIRKGGPKPPRPPRPEPAEPPGPIRIPRTPGGPRPVAAQDEDDVQRQALTLVGPPKTGQPRETE